MFASFCLIIVNCTYLRYALKILFSISVCSTAKMDFLEEEKKEGVASADCEIIDVESLSFKIPEKVDKGKIVTMVPQKRKASMPPTLREKLMRDVLNARTVNEGLDIGPDPIGGTAIGGRFVPTWRLGRDTSLATMAERKKWATFALPQMVRIGFSKNSDREIEARTNPAAVEVSL